MVEVQVDIEVEEIEAVFVADGTSTRPNFVALVGTAQVFAEESDMD